MKSIYCTDGKHGKNIVLSNIIKVSSNNVLGTNISYIPGADPEILKRGGALCRPAWLAGEKKFRFQMV